MIDRRAVILGSAALAVIGPPTTPAEAWKAEFATEFARHVDWASATRDQIFRWIQSEADAAWENADFFEDGDPVAEARGTIDAIRDLCS